VNRTGGSSGAVTVAYATVNGTAVAGTAYTAASGTLSWASGDATAKTFAVTISSSPAFSGVDTFTVQLSGATGGATLATPTTATVSITGSSVASSAGPSARVQGNHLIDVNGNVLQLRGVDVSGLEFWPIEMPAPYSTNYWGASTPNLTAIQSWKANALRIPLNEQSYLAQTCYQFPVAPATTPAGQPADPLGIYRTVVKNLVDQATALGMYVILDLHKNAPLGMITGSSTPLQLCSIAGTQMEMADSNNSVAFWTAVANDFKSYPNVIFDLFNEPHIDNYVPPSGVTAGETAEWDILLNGGTDEVIYADNQTLTQNWTTAGMQSMLNAVRATGATNVVMAAGVSWAQDESQWVTYAPVDALGQVACSWHAYPSASAPSQPGYPNNFIWAAAILAAGYPIIIGETGDESSTGATALWLPTLLPWADTNEVSVLAWSWNAWGAANDDLITDAAGDPTDGEGVYFKNWLVNHK
jgi:endoglucanase